MRVPRPLICTKSDGEYTGASMPSSIYPGSRTQWSSCPLHTHSRLASFVQGIEVSRPQRLLLVKLMVYCWASDTLEVTVLQSRTGTCQATIYPQARSGLREPSSMVLADSEYQALAKPPVTGSRKPFLMKVWQNSSLLPWRRTSSRNP